MPRITEKDRVDSLIEHFWENGYLTLSRKHGKYLPKPSKIGEFEVDAVGKQNKKFVLGLTLSEKDIESPNILRKIRFLANQRNKYSARPVTLFLGVPDSLLAQAKKIMAELEEEVQKHIKVVSTSPSDDLDLFK